MEHSKKIAFNLASYIGKLTQNSKGFTLIELLVIFSVVAVLSGVGVVALSTYSQAQQLTQASNNMKLLLQEARANAISSVNTTTNSDGQVATCGARKIAGYIVSTNINLNSIELSMLCEGSPSSSVSVRVYELPSVITISSSTTCSDIIFDALTATASGVPCVINISGFNEEKSISVDSGGNVFVN